MNLDFLSAFISIVASILTILLAIKQFFSKDKTPRIKQDNKFGINTYTDASTTVNNSFKKNITYNETVNNNGVKNTQNDDQLEKAIALFTLGTIILGIILSVFSQTYKIVPAVCLLLLVIVLYKDSKLPFKNKAAKIQWGIERILTFALIITLHFIPQPIMNIINQIPPMKVSSFSVLLDWLGHNIKIIFDLRHSPVILLNFVGIIVAIFIVVTLLIDEIRKHKNTHEYNGKSKIISFIILIGFGLSFSNLDYVWYTIEPVRESVNSWFSSYPQ
ncbi:hypothetical protein ACFFGV_19665 [Pontibacillus salicampi]|uniref:Uncharacterized protein n=1 Tax=Pontibacillus salicampi TaxID=1449801 RepID=A0ABV6LTS8_9BACI